MSDSDSDEKPEKYNNDNYKSPSKKKRQKKGEGGGVPKNYCFEISLAESNPDKFTEVSFLDLVAKDELRIRKLAAIAKAKNGGDKAQNGAGDMGGLDPYADDDDEKLKAMAASFEAKYAEKTKPKKPAGKKRKIYEYDDLGEGYDENDPFIDNSECFDEVVPQEITTAHGGFYINTGALEFKSNQNAVYNLSSGEDSSPESKKAKKPKKDIVKKKVQFKDGKEVKKAKVINTEVKRRARIINTDKKIKGPKIINTDAKKMDKLKVDIKKIDVKHLDVVKKFDKRDKTPPPKSPEKSIPKPPEIIDLEAQLEALSNSVDLSKSESKDEKNSTSFSKPVQSATKVSVPGSKQDPPGYKALPVKTPTTPKSDPKVPPSVKVTKVVEPKPSPNTNGSTAPKPGWQNQINFPTNLDVTISSGGKSTLTTTPSNSKEKSKTPPTVLPTSSVSITKTSSSNISSAKDSKSSWEPKKPTASLPKAELPSISKAMDLSSPKVRTQTTPNSNSTSSPHSMFQHDPKNILSSTPSDMSSILGTTAAYFQQKMQQKAETSKSEPKAAFSPPNRGYYTSPKASKSEGGTVFSSPKSIPSVSKVQSSLPVKATPQESPTTPVAKQGSDISQEIGRQAAQAFYQQMQAQQQQQQQSSLKTQQQNSQLNQLNSQKNQLQSSQKNQLQSSQKNQLQSSQKNQLQNSQKNQQQSSQMNQQQNLVKPQQQQLSTLKSQPQINSLKTDSSPSSTSKIVPDQSKKISSSSGPAKLPTTPTPPPKAGPTTPSQMLTPDMTNSLLGIAQNMMNNLQQQQTLPQQPARPSQAVAPQQQAAYMQQYQQQQAAAAPQHKKSSGYDISNLLNSQPLPSAQPNSLSPANRSSPTAAQQQQQPAQPVRSVQQARSPVISQAHGLVPAHSQQQVQQAARPSALSQQTQQQPRSPSLSQQSPQVTRTPTLPQQQHPQSARSPSLSQQQQIPQSARPSGISQQASQLGRSPQTSHQQVPQGTGSPVYSQQIPQLANLQQQFQQAAAASRSPTLSQQALSQQQVTQAALLQQYQQNYYMGGMGGYQ